MPTRTIIADSHHEKWHRPPEPKYHADSPAWNPDNPDASRWKMPPPNQVKHNEMPELSVLAMIGHARVETCDVEYDHATKRRICRLGVRDLTDDEIAEIRAMRGVEVESA
jgi:hypothetical protein